MIKNLSFKLGLMTLALMLMSAPLFAKAEMLNRELEVGSTGSDVGSLQTFLAQDVTLYPQGLVTNYFGFLTKAAVSNFQSRNGLPPVGRVGPMTLPILNAQMSGGGSMGGDRSAPMIYSLNLGTTNTTATLNWNTSEGAAAIVYYSTSPIALSESGPNTAITVYGTSLLVHTDLRVSHSATLTGLQPNTVYYYVVYTRDGSSNESITWPSSFRTNS